MRSIFATVSLLLVFPALWGCSYPVAVMDPAVQRQWYPFLEERVRLEDVQTTRREVREAFGEPTATLEGGRIWAYRMRLDREEYFLFVDRDAQTDAAGLGEWTEAVRVPLPKSVSGDKQGRALRSKAHRYSLVLVFEGDVLQRHSLVRLR
jgi:hypothetical protein